MTRNAARSLPAAERRALAGENESQDSQEKLLFLIQEHGIGVTTSSPTPDDEPQRVIKVRRLHIRSPWAKRRCDNHDPRVALMTKSKHFSRNASDTHVHHPNLTNADADVDTDTDIVVVAAFTSSVKRSSQRLRQPTSSVAVTSLAPTESVPARLNSRDALPVDEPISPQTRDDAIHRPLLSTALLKTKTRVMSSQSPTQTNEGRSYEQYARDGSQPSSPPGSFTEEHRTLQEGDTGYVDFKYPFDLPDTAPVEPDTPLPRNNEHDSLHDRSQFTSQLTTTRTNRFAPETPQPSLNLSSLVAMDKLCRHLSYLARPNRHLDLGKLARHHRETSRSPSPADGLGVAGTRDEDGIDKAPLPKLGSRKGRSGLEPIDEYKPYRKQVLDSEATRSSSQHSLDSDFERDEAELRRQRAKSNKERASRSFPEISVPPPSSGRAKVEIPSTNCAKRSKGLARTNSEEYIAQRYGKDVTDNDGSQETVADSQDIIVEQKSTNGTNTPVLPARDHSKSLHEDFNQPLSVPIQNVEDKEMIPETSPAPMFTEAPKLIGDIMRESSSAPSGLLTMSYPTPSPGASVEPSGSLNKPNQSGRNASSLPAIDKCDIDSVAVASSPSVVLASSQQSRRRSSRLNNTTTPSSTAPQPLLPSDLGSTSSTLTVLSTTPAISSSLTPNTEDGPGAERPDDTVSVPSPAAERGCAGGARHRRCLIRPRLQRDRRHKSPAVSTPGDSRTIARKPPRKSTTLREFQTKCGIFEGMVFAISFQERPQPQKCKDKSLSKDSLEEMIRQEGGNILDDGFNALFEVDTFPTSTKASSTPVLSSSLNLLDNETGFTALIADGHSRKVKYMQALALGIPCLAPKWVTTCVSKKEIVDWSSYLLCAGSSTLLGEAIRSRNLQPYDATMARLAQVISQRPKLLDESKILLMMKKTNNEKRLPYVFLAQVLGASLVRVHSVEEARAKLREAETGDNAFDWVYVDDHLQDARTSLFGSTSRERPSKKRKRTSTNTDVDDQPPKRIRTLNDELVIQSLILGRLIEENEIEI
ncbi:hypothetical protein CIB48_g2378 [Xylaria polymorpha]|nr:hypothetical protein CIB48_g2378 [Xylaria polymorpha]